MRQSEFFKYKFEKGDRLLYQQASL